MAATTHRAYSKYHCQLKCSTFQASLIGSVELFLWQASITIASLSFGALPQSLKGAQNVKNLPAAMVFE
jgi:hypothetical protein